jgi:hypothetical protein
LKKNIAAPRPIPLRLWLSQAATKEKLLELMKDAPDIEALRHMDQADLAIEYAERCAAVVPNRLQQPVVPI